MTASPAPALLQRLRDLDVKVWVEGDRLRINAPKDVLTDALKSELTACKADLIALLGTTKTAGAPLSFSQQRLWFLDQLRPGSPEYNMFGATRLKGVLNGDALERAIATVIDRHDAIRTRFPLVDGTPVQVVEPPGEFHLPRHDLENIPEARREKELQELLQRDAAEPFDLSRGPLFRATLYRLRKDEHVLMSVMHHTIGDGWSGTVFIRELGLLYPAYLEGKPSPLEPLPAQYADLARRQRRWLEGDQFRAELAYWTRQLEGLPEALELPTDRVRPPMQTANGARERVRFPPGLMDRIETLSRREGVTPFMTLLAGLATLLMRYSGQEDIAVGTPIANRTSVESEQLIGFFANTLVLRADMSGNPTFRDLLKRVREAALGAYAHQDVPFEKLVEVLKPVRDLSRSPLFQVLFAFQNLPLEGIELPGLRLEPIVLQTSTVQADVALYVGQDLEGYFMSFEYNTDMFDRWTIQALVGHFTSLLDQVCRDAAQPLLAIPILSPEERHHLLTELNATASALPAGEGIHDLILRQAESRPRAIAAVCGEESLSYGELHSRVILLAARLRECGVRPGVLVALAAERSIDMLVALLAILEAGGAYVPLDPAYPKDRLAVMLEDAGCAVLLTQSALEPALPPHRARTILLDRVDWSAAAPAGNGIRPTPDDPAYVIFTSGSTGKPKGVQIPHRALRNVLASMAREPGLGSADTLLAVTTLSFDIAGLELFLPLLVGGRVILAAREEALDPARLMQTIDRHQVTAMQATPATWRMLTEAGWQGHPGFRILCGGEALPPRLAEQLLQGGNELWNLYGPTETTIWSTVHRVGPGESPVSIGRPIANTRVYVLDPNGGPTPVGVPGELHIGGVGVALGYLNRPDLTAERFLPDPFASEPGARMYRTGDRVRWRPDGTLEYLGRLDFQVKIRGFRVELGEIETVLARHPAIAQAVVQPGQDTAGVGRLAAYVALRGSASPTAAELREFLGKHLPEYMVPSTFTTVAAFPLTPNGKVDRLRLPAPGAASETRKAGFVAPRTEIEKVVATVWREALGVDSVSATDNFFDLGGHSLMIVKVRDELRKTIGQELSIVEMFQYPTVRTLAGRITRLAPAEVAAS